MSPAVLVALLLAFGIGIGPDPAAAQQTREELARMLPADEGLSHADLARSEALQATPGFAVARVAHNPLAADARSVGPDLCTTCHQLESEHFSHTIHALGMERAYQADASIPVCEACHGAGSAHAADPVQSGLIIGFSRDSASDLDTQTGACLACHEGGPRNHWAGSVHQRNDLSCSDCHNPMGRFSAEGLLARESISTTCATCHKDIELQFHRRSHMPLHEGQISCADCHNPHGSITPPLLKTDTVNETCYQCHAEKRGPFLFEHAPVRDNCLNCHLPHGSNQASLLVAPIPFLCQQCHTHVRHPNDLQVPESLADETHPDERLIARGCISCHAQIHGSNNPSGPRFHR